MQVDGVFVTTKESFTKKEDIMARDYTEMILNALKREGIEID